MQLSASELLSQFRTRAGLSPERLDCSIDITAGIDADALLTAKMNDWYASLVDTAGEDCLDPEDVAKTLNAVAAPDGTVTVDLPEVCRRVFSIKLKGWESEATVIRAEDHPRLLKVLRATSRLPRVSHPYAILHRRRLTLFSLPPGEPRPVIATARGVMLYPGFSIFRLSPKALSLIPSIAI